MKRQTHVILNDSLVGQITKDATLDLIDNNPPEITLLDYGEHLCVVLKYKGYTIDINTSAKSIKYEGKGV